MHIIYDTETSEFFSFTKKIIDPGNIKLYSPFVMSLDKGLFATSTSSPFIIMQIDHIGMTSQEIKITGTEQPVILPSFIRSENGLSLGVVTDLEFYPEEGHLLFLAFDLSNGITSLLTVEKWNGEWVFRGSGVPNVHGDGKLCTGQATVPSPAKIATIGLFPWITEWMAAWTSAPFNSDLMRERHAYTLRFDPETRRNIPLPSTLRATCYERIAPDANVSSAVKGVLDYAYTNY
jgi:hypothetical protein